MKNIAIVIALVFGNLSAIGQDKEPAEKTKTEVDKKVSPLDRPGSWLKIFASAVGGK
ncbi:MAG: hypothetical protein MK165_06685 [Pirellulaceae bacterium]|nr:hypothetical protein [Pirellulaceae bacterium]